MKIEDIELHVGEVTFEYEEIRNLEAKCEATMAFSPAPTVDEMNAKLRAMASKVGANAVINIEYNTGVSMTSWKSMKGTGIAVRKLSDDIVCHVCAETIKRAAIKCRYCNADIPQAEETVAPQEVEHLADDTTQPIASYEAEPLRETNNPQTWLIVGAVIFIILTIIGAAGGS